MCFIIIYLSTLSLPLHSYAPSLFTFFFSFVFYTFAFEVDLITRIIIIHNVITKTTQQQMDGEKQCLSCMGFRYGTMLLFKSVGKVGM